MEPSDPPSPRPVVLVVDAANVVGSRPDGWWSDRQGATRTLRDHLVALARDGMEMPDAGPDGPRVRPDIVLVTEGRARGLASTDGVTVVDAAGEGDDEIVDTVRRLLAEAPSRPVVVVATADRELRSRVQALGATCMSARAVRHPSAPGSR